MTEFEDQRDIIRTIQILDRDAVDEIADTIGAVIERFRQATQTLTAQLDQAQKSSKDTEQASADLQQRLRLGVQLLKALEERADEIKDIGQSLDSRRQAAIEAEQRLEEKFAEFDQRLGEAATKFEQQTQNTSDVILERAIAVSELVEAAEVNVALMARRVSQALPQAIAQPNQQLSTPSVTSVSATNIEPEPIEEIEFDAENEIAESDAEINDPQDNEYEATTTEPLQLQPSISSVEIDELITSGDTLRSELNQLSALCEQLKIAQQTAQSQNAQFADDELVDESLQEEPSLEMVTTNVLPELRVPINRLSTLLEQLRQTTLDQQQQRYIKAAEFAVSGMNDLVESADKSGCVDSRDFEIDAENFDLHSCIEEVIGLIGPNAQKAQLVLSQSIHNDVPTTVRGNQGLLIRALVMAIGQAIQQATLDEVVLNVTVEFKTNDQFNLRFAISERRVEDGAKSQDKESCQDDNSFGDTEFSKGVFGRLIEQMHGNFGVDSEESEGFLLWFCVPLGKSLTVFDDHRANARLPQEQLKCNFGEVMNLSLGGMKVQCKRVPKGDLVDIELTSGDISINLKGVVVRKKKLSFRKHVIGIKFSDVDSETAKLITEISLNHWFRPTMGTW